MQPEVPEKSQGTPTADGHSFGSMQGEGVRCGLGLVHWRSALNERQRVLLERLAAGEEPRAWAPGEWRSAYALRDRGLLMVSKSGGDAHVEVTEAGRFYLRHGCYPDDPAFVGGSGPAVTAETRTPYRERLVARARLPKARDLIERLVAEGRVRFADPDDDEVAEWRRVVNYAKRHGLEPEGKRIEKVQYGGPGLETLSEGRARSGPGRSVRFADGRPWRRRRRELFGINLPRCFARRPDAGRRPPYSVSTAMLWNVVLANRAAAWTSRFWNRPDAGCSGRVNSLLRSTPRTGFRGCQLQGNRRQTSSRDT